MTATEKLKLQKINTSDYVSPDTINDNFEKLDVLGVDYIVECGTSGEWWYRKWNSGRAECGIDDKNFGSVDCTKAWGGVYVGMVNLDFGAFPFAFSSTPYVNIFPSNIKYGNSFNITVAAASNPLTKMPIFDIWRGTPISNIENVRACCYVSGRYK